MNRTRNFNWKFIAVISCIAALISWRVYNISKAERNESNSDTERDGKFTDTLWDSEMSAPLKNGGLSSNRLESDDYAYQISTNLEALPLKKRLYVTNNFIPLANQFLRQFPTQHHPFEAKDIKAVSVNYGVNGYVWALAKIESPNGSFQFLAQTINGTNHVQAFQDFTDFNILVPGTASDLKKFPSGSDPSTITTAAKAKAVVGSLLQQYNFDFQTYLNPPVAVPYTACSNFGLWEVRYLRKNATSNHEFVGFVADGTGKSGPYFRLVEQSSTWSLPFTLEK